MCTKICGGGSQGNLDYFQTKVEVWANKGHPQDFKKQKLNLINN